jgi:hypothetical protein
VQFNSLQFRALWRGPIEVRFATQRLATLLTFPRSLERGPIEAADVAEAAGICEDVQR